VLSDLVDRLAEPATRFDMLKMLRVLRMSVHRTLSTRAKVSQLPSSYYKVFADPRLSNAAALAGCATIGESPWHLDIDWFGGVSQNWWPAALKLDGAVVQKTVARALVSYLEWSFDLPPGGVTAKSWTWPGPTGGDPWDEFKTQVAPDTARKLVIEWHLVKGAKSVTTEQENGVLIIRTPRPRVTDMVLNV